MHSKNVQNALGFAGGSDGKNSACNVGDLGLMPGLGGSHGEGSSYPLQYSCLEISMDRGAWLQSMGSQRVRHFHFSFMLLLLSHFSRVQFCATP